MVLIGVCSGDQDRAVLCRVDRVNNKHKQLRKFSN